MNAYFIELKGSDIKRGIEQLDETAKMLWAELINYTFFEHKNREIVDIL